MMVLSLDPEMRIGESSFSFWECPATMDVTHPLCPSRIPCGMNSAMTFSCSVAI